ncbi:MAG TPA: imidazoleglycerol-phosphate dehydratase, partial [Armatimonadota bacterium]|nr:imidazoleglycerol-phosphate dehydratase [Armatimonadota bacterium]
MSRTAEVHRKTKETDVRVKVELDGSGESAVSTGVGFFDYMLDQIARHSLINLDIKASGDLV